MDVYPEIHHLNFDGKAGQERRGDEFTIPLCRWHHQGHPGIFKTKWMRENVGPSLAKQSRSFRAMYGTDDQLLAKVNDLIEQMEGVANANGTRRHEITPQRRACP